jgi:integrase
MSLKLITRKGSGHFYLRGTVRGQTVFETTGTDDKEAAEAIRIKREAQLLDRSIFGAEATVTFAEAAASYLEAGGEAKYLGRLDLKTGKWSGLIGQFMTTPVAAIGQVEADNAARALFPATSAATRKRQAYAPLKAVLNHAADKWRISVQRIKNPKVAKTAVEWATPDYVKRLLPHCAPKLRRFVAVIVYTGERLEKVIGIDWDRDVDLSLRTITFATTKNGEMRTVHIPDPLLVELSAIAETERHGRMFDWSDKGHVHRPLRNACKRAGLPYLSPHKLGRHTFATWLRRYAGRDLRGLMEDGGWKSVNSVVRYAHVVPGETVMAVDKLPCVHSESNSNVKPLKDRRIRKKLA